MCPFYVAKYEFNSYAFAKNFKKIFKTSHAHLDFWNILHYLKKI
jgi:hypothetical protein